MAALRSPKVGESVRFGAGSVLALDLPARILSVDDLPAILLHDGRAAAVGVAPPVEQRDLGCPLSFGLPSRGLPSRALPARVTERSAQLGQRREQVIDARAHGRGEAAMRGVEEP